MKLLYLFMIVLLAGSASAFSIVSPESDYYNGDIYLVITHNETLDELNYTLNGETTAACTNCSDYSKNLSLSKGGYTLVAKGVLGNQTFEDSVSFTVVEKGLPVCDHNGDGERDLVDWSIFGMIADEFDVNGDGVHDLVDLSIYSRMNQDDEWCIEHFGDIEFELRIRDPDNEEEYDGLVPVRITSNKELDSISYEVDGVSGSCEDCDVLTANLNLSEGNYTLVAEGVLKNISQILEVNFTVKYDEPEDNETDDDDDCDNCYNHSYNYSKNNSEPRFDLGFEKLPQMVEAGELSDEELAEIIRENKLNPGILNRLIKTGKLGNESIEAILDTQFKPQGIFSKLMSLFGVEQDTYAKEIYKNYDLSEKNQQKILGREDLPKKYKNQVREQLEEERQERSNKVPPGQAKKGLGVGSQFENDEEREAWEANRVERQKNNQELCDEDCDEEPKKDGTGRKNTPPGQAKKGK